MGAYENQLEQTLFAAFSAAPLTGTAPLTVTFTDLSTGDPTSWAWDLGDGITNTLQHPTHTYSQTGVYTVTLAVSNATGSDTLTKTNYITVTEPLPVANFSASPTAGPAPLTVVFTNTSTGDYTEVRWDYGDGPGYAGTLLLSSHVYAAIGSYTVTLTVGNGVVTSTLTRPNYIRVTEGRRVYLPLVVRNSP
jgi:PKD repeat protein